MKMGDSLLLCSSIAAVIALKASLSQANILLAWPSAKRSLMLVTGLCMSFKTTHHLLWMNFLSLWSETVKNSPKQNKQLTECFFLLWFAAIMTSPTLKARQCELMAPVPPSQSALSRQQRNRLWFKTNICTSLWALSLFSHITFNSFQVIWTGWCQNTKPLHGCKTKEWCQLSFVPLLSALFTV